MEKLLLKFLQSKKSDSEITINDYKINGADCYVEYKVKGYGNIISKRKINIWDMLIFLNS